MTNDELTSSQQYWMRVALDRCLNDDEHVQETLRLAKQLQEAQAEIEQLVMNLRSVTDDVANWVLYTKGMFGNYRHAPGGLHG
jgi:hypothetical protein